MSTTTWRGETVRLHRSRWSQDPNIAMAYSYLKCGGTIQDREELARGERGLHYAGEACSGKYPGSMHGAWFTGVEAARACAGAGRVIIVGAGLAGLAAARELFKMGVPTTILEASDHAYGRAWRGDHEKVIDGGMWLHGNEGHPLLPYIQKANIATKKDHWEIVEGDPGGFSGPTFYRGKLLDAGKQSELFGKYRELEDRFDSECRQGDLPLAAAFTKIGELGEEEAGVLSAWLGTLYTGIVAGSLRDLSTRNRLESFMLPGDDLMLTKPVSDLEEILSGLHIEYGTHVTSVSLNEGTWCVEDRNGNRREADKVIMTVPISVLGRIKITPEMSEKKRDAVGRIGVGKLEKIWVLFEKKHWGDLSHFYLTEPGSLCNVYIDVSEVCDQPALLTFVGNDRVEMMDRMGDNELLNSVLKEVEESGAFSLS